MLSKIGIFALVLAMLTGGASGPDPVAGIRPNLQHPGMTHAMMTMCVGPMALTLFPQGRGPLWVQFAAEQCGGASEGIAIRLHPKMDEPASPMDNSLPIRLTGPAVDESMAALVRA